jgi:DNA-binding CsgD family transcriptional regulator
MAELGGFSAVLSSYFASASYCISENRTFDDAFQDCEDSVYVKSADGKILYANDSYARLFSTDGLPLGRDDASFLQETVLPVAKASDTMILSGCEAMLFDHLGHDALGRSIMFRTGKRSLLGSGHPSAAILGVTRVREVLQDKNSVRSLALTEKWNKFVRLDSADQEIAVQLALGRSPSQIASQKGLNKKTIENHRRKILEQVAVDSQIDLARLLVQLQERGFGDLGL